MFNNLFCRQSAQSIATRSESGENTYIEVAGLMDDFMSLEEVAPGAEWSDVLAASWGIPCETATPQARPALNLKASSAKALRGLFQTSRSKLEVA
jgi:hypothetical protein